MTIKQASCRPQFRSSNNRSNVKNSNLKTPVSNSWWHQISTKVWFLSQIARHRSLPSHRKSLLKLHLSRHPVPPHHRNRTLFLLSRSLKLAIIPKMSVVKSSPHPTYSKWTTSPPFSKPRAPRRTFICSAMCSLVCKSGTYRLSKLVGTSVQCL